MQRSTEPRMATHAPPRFLPYWPTARPIATSSIQRFLEKAANDAASALDNEMKQFGDFIICGPLGEFCMECHIQSHTHLKQLWNKLEEAEIQTINPMDVFLYDELNEDYQIRSGFVQKAHPFQSCRPFHTMVRKTATTEDSVIMRARR